MAVTYKVELIDQKDPLSRLERSKLSIKDLFNYLLDETKGFKYQITVKILLTKYKGTEIEFSPVHFNSTSKIVINHRFDFNKSFQEIGDCINEEYGWTVELIESQYIDISTLRPLIGSFS